MPILWTTLSAEVCIHTGVLGTYLWSGMLLAGLQLLDVVVTYRVHWRVRLQLLINSRVFIWILSAYLPHCAHNNCSGRNCSDASKTVRPEGYLMGVQAEDVVPNSQWCESFHQGLRNAYGIKH